jgi:hypothetical protein
MLQILKRVTQIMCHNGGKLLGHQHDNIEVSHEVGEL